MKSIIVSRKSTTQGFFQFVFVTMVSLARTSRAAEARAIPVPRRLAVELTLAAEEAESFPRLPALHFTRAAEV